MAKYPVTQAGEAAPEGNVPNPRKRHGGEHNVSSSSASPAGHTDYGDRMSHPFRDGFAPNDETGEGQGS
jgi:hypothetical protein